MRTRPDTHSTRRQIATVALFIALAILHTWPLAAAPAQYWHDTGDYHLNTWALAWIAHQLPRDPAALYHANIFHPERWTLAFSETLLPQALFAVPVIWLGGSPNLGYNVSLLAGFALTGWATSFVIARWTGNGFAGVLAGCLAAFNSRSLTNLAHLQALHVMYLPLALLALDRLLASARWRHVVVTGACLALQALTSSYWVVFTAVSAAVAAVVRAPEWWPLRRGMPGGSRFRTLALLAAAGVTATVLLAPALYPYWQVREEHGFKRPLRDAARYSAKPSSYLRGSSRVHVALGRSLGSTSRRGQGTSFPGLTCLVLTGVAVASGVFWRDPRARMLVAIAATGLVLSFGPATPLYRWLYDIGLLQNMRVASRFASPAFWALAGLAGFGLACLLRSGPIARANGRQVAAGVTAILLVNIEALRAPIAWDETRQVPSIYKVVASRKDAVIVEVPFPGPKARSLNARYLPAATVHWKPMVNGYSGFLPGSYQRLWSAGMNQFPAARSLDALRAVGVTHIVVHRHLLGRRGERVIKRLEGSGRVELVAVDGTLRLYQLLH